MRSEINIGDCIILRECDYDWHVFINDTCYSVIQLSESDAKLTIKTIDKYNNENIIPNELKIKLYNLSFIIKKYNDDDFLTKLSEIDIINIDGYYFKYIIQRKSWYYNESLDVNFRPISEIPYRTLLSIQNNIKPDENLYFKHLYNSLWGAINETKFHIDTNTENYVIKEDKSLKGIYFVPKSSTNFYDVFLFKERNYVWYIEQNDRWVDLSEIPFKESLRILHVLSRNIADLNLDEKSHLIRIHTYLSKNFDS